MNNAGRSYSNPSHDDWEFRREAALWTENGPTFPNLYPIGSQLRDWMMRKGTIQYFAHADRKRPNAPTNPFTYNGYILATAYSRILNESHEFATSTETLDENDAEIKYMRLSSELILYTTRVCETLIKQMLFCTDFLPKQYELSALGGLLSSRCKGCQKGGKKHFVSLLGSLAHRYGLCGPYENCLHEKMVIVNHRRNERAAHSGVLELHGRSVRQCREAMSSDISTLGEELIHMLNHISDIELRMIDELRMLIRLEKTATFEVRFPIQLETPEARNG